MKPSSREKTSKLVTRSKTKEARPKPVEKEANQFSKVIEPKKPQVFFQRSVLVCGSNRKNFIHQIIKEIIEINSQALPHISNPLTNENVMVKGRTPYLFTTDEEILVNDGTYSILTGFLLVDENRWISSLEGLPATLDMLFQRINATEDLALLINTSQLFTTRLYTSWGPELKRFRLKSSLESISMDPCLYIRRHNKKEAAAALDQLLTLIRASKVHLMHDLRLCPTIASLTRLDELYGCPFSDIELSVLQIDNGVESKFVEVNIDKECLFSDMQINQDRIISEVDAFGKFTLAVDATDKAILHDSEYADIKPISESDEGSDNGTDEPPYLPKESNISTYNAADLSTSSFSRNREYEKTLRKWAIEPKVDFQHEHRVLRQRARQSLRDTVAAKAKLCKEALDRVLGFSNRDRHETIDSATQAAPLPSQNQRVYPYAQQRLSYHALAAEDMRHRLLNGRLNKILTYNKLLLNLTVAPPQPGVSALQASTALSADRVICGTQTSKDKTLWQTKEGFLWPKPKSTAELIRHPDRPAEARIEDLKQPWTEPIRPTRASTGTEPVARNKERMFKLRFHADETFGYLKPPKFELPLDYTALCKKKILPRGRMTSGDAGDRDSTFFKSMHLSGDEAAVAVKDAALTEKRRWQEKVVVDSLTFSVGEFLVRDKPQVVDKYTSQILKDAPATAALKHLRCRRSRKGKDWGYSTAPASVLSSEPFLDRYKLAGMLTRAYDTSVLDQYRHEQEYCNDSDKINQRRLKQTHNRYDGFKLFIRAGVAEPAMYRAVAKRRHEPLRGLLDSNSGV